MALNETSFEVGTVLDPAFLNAIPRGNNEQVALQRFPLPISQMRYSDGDPVNATGGAGDPQIAMSGWADGSGVLRGQDAHGTTKTETVFIDFAVPESYCDGEDIRVGVRARVNDTGSGVMTTKTVDVAAYKIDSSGAAGADICATDEQEIATNSLEYAFVLTPTGVVRGDLLRIYFRTVITESGGSGTQKAEIGGADVMLDIKG